jgi:glycosyltransferase involved in cell wall biosynthesis
MVRGKMGSVLFMSTFPPRECGIATFTRDLSLAVKKRFKTKARTKVLAMNKSDSSIYNYPGDVAFQVIDSDLEDYINTAKRLNRDDSIKIVNIQHEFGIFGGDNGKNLIPFLEVIEKPVITTFHSVLPHPDEEMKKVVEFIGKKSEAIVVMNNSAVNILRKHYDINCDIVVIPHGIPHVRFEPSEKNKAILGFKGKTVLCSFGLMSSGKGYEQVIDALPAVIEKFPNLLYIIVGETHPVVRMNEGEEYRNSLQNKVKQLGLARHVKFYNKYVTLQEIIKFLKASDIYICSNIEPKQITSGTLSYAMGCGRAVVSTPFVHAKEYVTRDRGLLAKFNQPETFSDAIINILSNPELKSRMERNAYAFTRGMTWPNVALSYMKMFDKYVEVHDMYGKNFPQTLPKISFNHIMAMTDGLGMIQFAKYLKPDYESGYCLDDNTRALLASVMHYEIYRSKTQLNLAKKYLDFMKVVSGGESMFYNFVDKNGQINTHDFSEDAHGRALQTLGYLVSSRSMPAKLRKEAAGMFTGKIGHVLKKKSPRAVAFSLIGMYHYNLAKPSEDNLHIARKLSDFLYSHYEHNSTKDWKWFEEYMTYSNAKLPESMFYSYLMTMDKKYLKAARESLDFLISVTFENGIFMPIGQRGWYFKNNIKSYYDQQPVDTCTMVQALIIANKVTGAAKYKELAIDAFNWFLGKNSLNQVVYDETSGGCHDGVGISSINLNQGAESTVSYLLARLSLAQNGFR